MIDECTLCGTTDDGIHKTPSGKVLCDTCAILAEIAGMPYDQYIEWEQKNTR